MWKVRFLKRFRENERILALLIQSEDDVLNLMRKQELSAVYEYNNIPDSRNKFWRIRNLLDEIQHKPPSSVLRIVELFENVGQHFVATILLSILNSAATT